MNRGPSVAVVACVPARESPALTANASVHLSHAPAAVTDNGSDWSAGGLGPFG